MAERFGVVLGAGGVLGAAWTIGALRALELSTGADPRTAEVIVGTSAGSVLAASLGCGLDTKILADHQSGVAAEGDTKFEFDYAGQSATPPRPQLRLGSKGLLMHAALHPRGMTPLGVLASILPQGRGSLDAVGALVDEMSPPGPIAWTPHPQTWIVAMDYRTGRRVPFGREGSPSARLSAAVVASCAIPGWYAPKLIGDRPYVDGGACSPTSLDLVVGLELDTVYVLSPMTSFAYDVPTTVAERLERRVRRLTTRRLVNEAKRVRAAGTRVVLISPGPADLTAIGANLMDPRRRGAVFTTALRTTAELLSGDPVEFAETG